MNIFTCGRCGTTQYLLQPGVAPAAAGGGSGFGMGGFGGGSGVYAPVVQAGHGASSGTVRSHIGIVSREFQVPCVMACTFAEDEPASGAEVELDCSGAEAVVRG